jgi:integrase
MRQAFIGLVRPQESRKRSKRRDESILAWFDEHLNKYDVQAITREVVQELRALKGAETSKATADRHMALLRSILNKCVTEWEVLDSAPKVPMYRPAVGEPRWLTRAEFARLERELPGHLKAAAKFAVLTGLRMRAMLSLTWQHADLTKKRAWVSGGDMKARSLARRPTHARSHRSPEVATQERRLRLSVAR